MGELRLFTLKETAKTLRTSERTARAMVAAGRIAAVRYGRGRGARVYVEAEDLRRFVQEHKEGGHQEQPPTCPGCGERIVPEAPPRETCPRCGAPIACP